MGWSVGRGAELAEGDHPACVGWGARESRIAGRKRRLARRSRAVAQQPSSEPLNEIGWHLAVGRSPHNLAVAEGELAFEVLSPQPRDGSLETGRIVDAWFPAEHLSRFAVAEILVFAKHVYGLS